MALNLPAEPAQFLRQHHVMTLATQGGDGPWAAALFYAVDGDSLIFLSSAGSRHVSDFLRQPRCAATIQSQPQDWTGIQGIQLEGEAGELPGTERAHAQAVYGARFPFVRPGVAPPAIEQALARVQWYRLRISCLYFIDNRRGFGQRQQFSA